MSRFDRIEQGEIRKIAKSVAPAGGGGGGAPALHASTHGSAGADPVALNASQITAGTLADARIPSIDAGKTTTGIFALARIPTHAGTHEEGGGDDINIDAGQIFSGVFADARIPSLDAAKTTTGVFGTARLGTGTAEAGAYLQGNSVWRIPYAPPKVIPFSGAIDAPGLWGDAFPTVVLVANTQKMVPYVPAFSFTPSVIGSNISGALSGLIQMAIYASDPATGLPVGSPLNTPSDLTTASTGNKETAYTTPVVAGTQYWLAVQSSAEATARAISLASLVVIVSEPGLANQKSIFNKTVTHGTWINFTSVPAVEADFVNGNMPLVYLRRA